ncbi:BNR-repeat neuraminidase N-terminal domain-containing protein [Pedobacter gandavensis]|uniref:BNR-repeat neuraminidase N-terminal domain-containing protein n=1 Tax=Pedobacter gandavensis TaxID=2679963 RepID=UPI002931D45E|nr:BNR-repeat neuraminidase N-terminal domain-containing protein [Pedobacter gandavensis]
MLVNSALHLDGNDNNPAIGMPIISKNWTLEAWVKGDDLNWKPIEAIISAGEYGHLSNIDSLPLMIKDGRLFNNMANLSSPMKLDNQWHHIAATCNGKQTRLFLDGEEVGNAAVVSSILPGVIGTSMSSSQSFGGDIDEVRIWDKALSGATIKAWMGKSIDRKHPDFNRLKAYYTFDQMQHNVVLNLVGKGHLPYHLRNGKINYKGNIPTAVLVKNTNPGFQGADHPQQVFNAVTIQSEWNVDQDAKDDQVLKLRIVLNGSKSPLKLTSLTLDLSKTTRLKDISNVHLYYTGASPRTTEKKELFGTGTMAQQKIQFKGAPGKLSSTNKHGHEAPELKEGVNYFLLTFDVAKDAIPGDTLHASLPVFALNGKNYYPEIQEDQVYKTVTQNSGNDPNVLKLLQWNIWHGGLHTDQGTDRVQELIKQTNADVLSMQEAYGSQQLLADALDFHLQTPSANANLALFSRYPMIQHPSNDHFKSNVATIELPNKRKVLLADWWLRYAYKYEYTDHYVNPGFNTNDWIEEDLSLNTADAIKNMDKDIDPVMASANMPVIVAGDFNSGSHLDWTLRAAPLHYGYGPVALPTSKLMMDRGYKDSFRELQPNELSHQGGTFAVIFGHLQTSRIDFVYYKGEGIQAKSSRIIRTAPDIDDIWVSDHAAVLTVFDTSTKK